MLEYEIFETDCGIGMSRALRVLGYTLMKI